MGSLKHHILILILGSLIILAGSLLIVLGLYMKDRDVAAAIVKAQADLATCGEIIDSKYPGSWSVQDGELYKGPVKISLNNDIADHLSKLTGDNVTFFLGDTRVATTVRGSKGERAIGTKVSANVAHTVLQNGQTYLGEADVVGQWFEAGYVPLRAENGNIIGMFYVGISHDYKQEFITQSLTTMAEIGVALTVLVVLFTWFLLQKLIINPLRNIALGTREAASGHLPDKINVPGAKEIKELEDAFNQMVEQIQALTREVGRANQSNPENEQPENISHSFSEQKGSAHTEPNIDHVVETKPTPQFSLDSPWSSGEEGLPKGLNKATLLNILQFLQTNRCPLSAEEVAEGVKLTRVTVRNYLEFLELRGVLKSEMKYGTVGRPVKLFIQL